MTSLPLQSSPGGRCSPGGVGHLSVRGDEALADRLAAKLQDVYRERVTPAATRRGLAELLRRYPKPRTAGC
ncbi:hypothetical protein [Streptomyces sp. NPDC018833]|uniref:hypothetical protein n=1 Tax=Streptomyces sp. NPDC018833 TaxID=3365053 RepID=UPI0037BA2F7C